MNIHEYQGKEIFRQYGVSVPNGKVAFTVDEAVEAAKELGTDVVCCKSTNPCWWYVEKQAV